MLAVGGTAHARAEIYKIDENKWEAIDPYPKD